jgi:two-component system, OmpR family, alkaline phosphatase synthesis response regulator PhoP
VTRIWIVEDEELIRTMLRINLERNGYQVTAFTDAESMLSHLEGEFFDILLLDIMLPGMSGDEALYLLRKKGLTVPVLMLTAKQDTESKVKMFENGADDYLAKPFNMDELLARVRALIRRSQSVKEIPSDRQLQIGSYYANLGTRVAVTRFGEVLLSEKEAKLLKFFAHNEGKTLSRNDILEEVWGLDVDPTPRTVDNFIVKLRRLFEAEPDKPKHFITVRSTGYLFNS